MRIFRHCSFVLVVAASAQALWAQRDSPADVFPLHIGNQWIYSYSSHSEDNENGLYGEWTGTVTLDIVASLAGDDSTRWTFLQQASLQYCLWVQGHLDTCYPAPYINYFELIEELHGQHRLYRENAGPSAVLAFNRTTFASDTTKVWRYRVVGPGDTTTFRIGWYPLISNYVYTFKKNVGMERVVFSYSAFPTGGGGHHFLLSSQITEIPVTGQGSIPSAVTLFPAYPNPFNPSTSVKFDLPSASEVKLSVLDILGREVAVLVNAKKPAGTYTIEFDGSGLSSGVYFYRLHSGEFVSVKKMLLMK